MSSGGSDHSSSNALPAAAVHGSLQQEDGYADSYNSSFSCSTPVNDDLGSALALRSSITSLDHPAVATTPATTSFQARKKRSYAGGMAGCSLTESLNGKHGLGSVPAKAAGCPRDRLQRHRLQVAGNVRIPEAWCGEERLREWVSPCDVEEAMHPPGLFMARAALIAARSSLPSSSSPALLAPPASPACEVSLLS